MRSILLHQPDLRNSCEIEKQHDFVEMLINKFLQQSIMPPPGGIILITQYGKESIP